MMTHQRSIKLSIICLGFILIFSACQGTSSTPNAGNQLSKTATSTNSIRPSPTFSPSPTPFSTPTLEILPSSTPTIRWEDRSLEGTPFSLTREQISQQNVDDVREVALWGTGRVNDLVLSPDGLILAVATNIGVYLYDSLDYELIARLPTQSPALTIAFSVDNGWIALGESDGTMEVFNYVEMTSVGLLRGAHEDQSAIQKMALSFTYDGSQLSSVITTPEEIQIHQWQTSDWQTTTAFSLERGITAYFNPDINLVGIFNENELRLQSLSHPNEYQVLPLTESVSEGFWAQTATFEPQPAPSMNGDFILVNTGNAVLHWEIQEDRISYRLDDYPSLLPNPCSIAPDTCKNAEGGLSWDCREESLIRPIEMIALTPDDVMMLITLSNGRSEFRRASDGMLAWQINQTFTQVTFSPGSEFFFGLRPDGVIEKRGTLDGVLLSYLNFHPNQLHDLAFSPDGSVLAAGFNNGLIHIYNPYNGELLGVLTGSARSLAFSPNGELLAGGLTDGTVRIYLLEGGRFYDIAPGHLAGVTDLHFLSDGERLLTVSEDCTMSLWDIQDRYRLEHITPNVENPFQISQVEIPSEDFQRFLSGFKAGVFAFDDTGQLEPIKMSNFGFTDLALSSNGDLLAAAGVGGSLMVDLRTQPYALTNLSFLEAFALTFTQDGTVLVLATRQAVAFWSLEDGKRLTSLSIYDGEVPGGIPATIEIAPDGGMIALGTQDGLIHIYSLP